MSRPKKIRINGERLRECIQNKGYKYREFAELVTDKEKEEASIWINRLLLPDTDKNKTGVSQNMLKRIASVLDVLPEYLTGEIDYPTEKEQFFSEMQKRIDEWQHAGHEADTLVTPLLQNAGYNINRLITDLDGSAFATFKKKNHEYKISTSDLRKIEKACIDLCSSLIQSMGTDISEMQ